MNAMTIPLHHFPSHLKTQLRHHREQIEALLTQKTAWNWDSLIYPMEELDHVLECLWSPLAHRHAVVNTPALRICYDACLPELSAHESAINQNQTLFRAIASLDKQSLNSAQQKIIDDLLQQFTLSGVGLNTTDQQRFQTLEARLSELSNQFENNILDAEAAFELLITDETSLRGLPAHALQTARLAASAKQQSGWLFTLTYPTVLAILTYADSPALRETIYRAYHTRASVAPFDNTPVLNEILALRQEQANLLGFTDYAAYSLATKMVPSATHVLDFLTDLVRRVTPQAKREVQALQDFAETELKPWDIAYVSQQKKQHEFALDDEQLRAYFPLPRVMDGVLFIIRQLFKIELREIASPVESWHDDMRCYALYDNQQQLRGYLLCDLFARANKRGGAWMDSLRSRMRLSTGKIELPIATLTCNFANTATDKPALLSHDEVVTLLHEMGHCLQHLLTEVDYLTAAGINGIEWDAVELPSQLLENWAWTSEGLALLSAHVDTGDALPDNLLTQLLRSKQFQAAMGLMRQLELALFDFQVHRLHRPVDDVLAEIQHDTRILPHWSEARLAQAFSHIFAGGYAAGYYSYLWAEVLSSDAFERFETEGILNAQTGHDFLREILAVGSTRSASESYRHFRGRDARIDAFLRHHGIH
jgi:oligopeptidase A